MKLNTKEEIYFFFVIKQLNFIRFNKACESAEMFLFPTPTFSNYLWDDHAIPSFEKQLFLEKENLF